MKIVGAAVGLFCFSVSGCAQALRGDSNQVYVDDGFALTAAQGIDAANAHCATYGKIALYRGRYSSDTAVFSCIVRDSGDPPTSRSFADAPHVDMNALHRLADLGDADAMLKLGVLYSGTSSSLGHLPADYGQSTLWLRRAADHGNSDAMTMLGGFYIKGQAGLTANPDEAIRWLRKASALGNPTAMYALGIMLSRDDAVAASKAEAMQWFVKSAQLGSVDAMRMSGIKYISAEQGRSPNYSEAMHWFRMAADKGDPSATFLVADLYRYGLGIPTDYSEAMRWSRKAAQLGDHKAMKLIGEMYEKGLGVPADKAQALYWYEMAERPVGN